MTTCIINWFTSRYLVNICLLTFYVLLFLIFFCKKGHAEKKYINISSYAVKTVLHRNVNVQNSFFKFFLIILDSYLWLVKLYSERFRTRFRSVNLVIWYLKFSINCPGVISLALVRIHWVPLDEQLFCN